ncbi:MAG: zinc ribbon domain-containing protein [Prevotellaceae bacterium]|jgi:predicted amidophosphoribosyltransferase|nr:zinc ribbon domain-containing protein [Prevotellaceae bacterium]
MEKERQQERVREKQAPEVKTQQKQSVQEKIGAFCPKCGCACTTHDNFCGECGNPMSGSVCPKCGHITPANADVCSKCGTYISKTKCQYCGADVEESDAFCGECGNPRSGIICPRCSTVTAFNFCSKCNMPLTEMGRAEREKALQEPKYKEVLRLQEELKKIFKQIEETENVDNSEKEAFLQSLQEKLLQYEKMLNERKDDPESPVQPPKPEKKESVKKEEKKTSGFTDSVGNIEELKKAAQERIDQIRKMYEEMETQEFPNPQIARTYYAARKPEVVNYVWKCKYKGLIHPSPEHCVSPHTKGEWIPYYGHIEWEYGLE